MKIKTRIFDDSVLDLLMIQVFIGEIMIAGSVAYNAGFTACVSWVGFIGKIMIASSGAYFAGFTACISWVGFIGEIMIASSVAYDAGFTAYVSWVGFIGEIMIAGCGAYNAGFTAYGSWVGFIGETKVAGCGAYIAGFTALAGGYCFMPYFACIFAGIIYNNGIKGGTYAQNRSHSVVECLRRGDEPGSQKNVHEPHR